MPHTPETQSARVLREILLQRSKGRSAAQYLAFGVACCRRLNHLPLPAPLRRLLDTLDRENNRRHIGPSRIAAHQLLDEIVRNEGWDHLSPVRLVSHAIVTVADGRLTPGSVQCVWSFTWRAEVAVSAALDDRLPPRGRSARRRALSDAWLALIQDVFPDPEHPVRFDPSWSTPLVQQIAWAAHSGREFNLLPILADALEDGGCTSHDLLEHLRWHPFHVHGCWALDAVLRS